MLDVFDGTDDYDSFATPILDTEGNLYGATLQGDSAKAGVVFKLANKAKQ